MCVDESQNLSLLTKSTSFKKEIRAYARVANSLEKKHTMKHQREGFCAWCHCHGNVETNTYILYHCPFAPKILKATERWIFGPVK